MEDSSTYFINTETGKDDRFQVFYQHRDVKRWQLSRALSTWRRGKMAVFEYFINTETKKITDL